MSRSFGRILLILLVLIAVALVWWFGFGRNATATEAPPSNLISALSEPAAEGFARAEIPNNIEFPRDLGPHDDYQTEWWYYTGNLADEAGREFGFQFTIFRRALAAPDGAESASEWRTNQIYLVHFTVSDISAEMFYHAERYSRGAAGLSGAQAEPYRVWVEDWFVEEQADGTVWLSAETPDYALNLNLTQTLPPILHGEGGLSAKSLEAGNASYYYSQIRQAATGTVRVGEETVAVTGKVWKDHEYSTSVLSEGATGWDWFSLQFDDGSALMLFEIRRADGSIEPASSGTFVFADGSTERLSADDWQIEVSDRWQSPATNAAYPSAWAVTIPKLDLALTGAAKMPNQELTLTAGAYWEGSVRFSGDRAGNQISGDGYIEMTGYVDSLSK